MADKYLPELQSTTVLQDDDLVYVTGVTTHDFSVNCKNLRNVFKPLLPSVDKTLSYTVQVSDCDGKWFSNHGAVSTVEFTLPLADDGLEVGFFVTDNKYVVVTPLLSNRIVLLASMDGQSVRSTDVGASLFLRATNHEWYVVHRSGNWAAV